MRLQPFLSAVVVAAAALLGASAPVAAQSAPVTLNFLSGPDWRVFSTSPGRRLGQYLGRAQMVCMNVNAPQPCPDGATRYEAAGFGWGANLASIPGAAWIWAPNVSGVTFPAQFQEYYFARTLDIRGKVVSATIWVSADDFAEVQVNGKAVGSIGSTEDVSLAGYAQSYLTPMDIAPYLSFGENAIVIRGKNGSDRFAGCWLDDCAFPYSQNPAGVVFGGSITYQPGRRP